MTKLFIATATIVLIWLGYDNRKERQKREDQRQQRNPRNWQDSYLDAIYRKGYTANYSTYVGWVSPQSSEPDYSRLTVETADAFFRDR